MTVSSLATPAHGANRIRLDYRDNREGAAGWKADFNDVNQWAQVSSTNAVWWTRVTTQGRRDESQWVTNYFISYSEDGISWHQLEGGKIFDGNADKNTKVTHDFAAPVLAKAIRMHPTEWNTDIAARLEFYFYENLA